jgi:DMSO/TMAO reductase YedYZ molybdopterin-dependent catalytic subunit
MAFCGGGYSANPPVEDLIGGKAMVAIRHRDLPLERVHGGPARLLVPHLYFWKSAEWVRGLRFMPTNEPWGAIRKERWYERRRRSPSVREPVS